MREKEIGLALGRDGFPLSGKFHLSRNAPRGERGYLIGFSRKQPELPHAHGVDGRVLEGRYDCGSRSVPK